MALRTLFGELSLEGLEVAPAQVLGSVRLVPLLRRHGRSALRVVQALHLETPGPSGHTYRVEPPEAGILPHGLAVVWTEGLQPLVSCGTQLVYRPDPRQRLALPTLMSLPRKLLKTTATRKRVFMPMGVGLEGLFTAFLGGPEIAWAEYTRQVMRKGLRAPAEKVSTGRDIRGLDLALRLFEQHPSQVGLLLFVADALAAAFVVPTPEDYHALHGTLLEDLYGELLYFYGMLYDTVYPPDVSMDASRVASLSDLEAELGRMRQGWDVFGRFLADGLVDQPVVWRTIHRAGPYTLQRFRTLLRPDSENHIGEAVIRATGELEYLKTFRLSAIQARRLYLLEQLATHRWDLAETSKALGSNPNELVRRLEKAGFAYMLKEEVLRAARRGYLMG